MRAVDSVAFLQGEHRAHGAALLADARVNRAVHQALGGQIEQVLLEGPNEDELAPHARQQLGVCSVPVLLGGLHPLPCDSREQQHGVRTRFDLSFDDEVCLIGSNSPVRQAM